MKRTIIILGVILLFLCFVYTPIIGAITDSYTIKSMKSSFNDSSIDTWPPSFFGFGFQRIKGKIKDFKIYNDEYGYYLNVTRVTITTIKIIIVGIPFPSFEKEVYEKGNINFPAAYIKNYKFVKEKVTDDYINCLIFIWGYFS